MATKNRTATALIVEQATAPLPPAPDFREDRIQAQVARAEALRTLDQSAQSVEMALEWHVECMHGFIQGALALLRQGEINVSVVQRVAADDQGTLAVTEVGQALKSIDRLLNAALFGVENLEGQVIDQIRDARTAIATLK